MADDVRLANRRLDASENEALIGTRQSLALVGEVFCVGVEDALEFVEVFDRLGDALSSNLVTSRLD